MPEPEQRRHAVSTNVSGWQDLATLAHKYGTQAVRKQNTEKGAKQNAEI
jgi:hypothetical protein